MRLCIYSLILTTVDALFLPYAARVKRYSVRWPMITALSVFQFSGISVTLNSASTMVPSSGAWPGAVKTRNNAIAATKHFFMLIIYASLFDQHYLVIVEFIDAFNKRIPLLKTVLMKDRFVDNDCF